MSTSVAAKDERRTGLLLLLATSLIWGVNWPVMKFLVGEIPPLTMRGIAGIAGAALAFAAARAVGERAAFPVRQAPRLVLLALLNIAGFMGLVTVSLLWLPASEAAILAYTMPIWAALLAWPVLGEKPGLARTGGLLLGFAGCAVLIGGQTLSASRSQLPGIACVLSAAVLFALGTVLSKRFPFRLPPITSLAWQVLIGTTPLLALGLLIERTDLGRLTVLGWAGIGYNAAFVLCLSYAAWFGALRRLPASTAAVGTLLVPVVGVFSAALLLGEPLGVRELAALALTLVGIAVATRA